jgi:hypothetical protein
MTKIMDGQAIQKGVRAEVIPGTSKYPVSLIIPFTNYAKENLAPSRA